jgi:hypothetical protein
MILEDAQRGTATAVTEAVATKRAA